MGLNLKCPCGCNLEINTEIPCACGMYNGSSKKNSKPFWKFKKTS